MFKCIFVSLFIFSIEAIAMDYCVIQNTDGHRVSASFKNSGGPQHTEWYDVDILDEDGAIDRITPDYSYEEFTRQLHTVHLFHLGNRLVRGFHFNTGLPMYNQTVGKASAAGQLYLNDVHFSSIDKDTRDVLNKDSMIIGRVEIGFGCDLDDPDTMALASAATIGLSVDE